MSSAWAGMGLTRNLGLFLVSVNLFYFAVDQWLRGKGLSWRFLVLRNDYFGDDVPNFPPFAFIDNGRLTCDPVDIDEKTLKSIGPRGHIHGSGPGQKNWSFERVMPTITRRAVTYIHRHGKRDFQVPRTLSHQAVNLSNQGVGVPSSVVMSNSSGHATTSRSMAGSHSERPTYIITYHVKSIVTKECHTGEESISVL